MKSLKRFAGLILALVLVCSLAMPVFAATEYQYEIYQIFTGDYYEGKLSNVKWGANAALPTGAEAGDRVSDEIMDELAAAYTAATDSKKLEVILQYADLTASKAHKTGSATKYEGLDDGYYLVKDVDDSLDGIEDEAYTLYVVKVVDGTLEFTRKAKVPTVDKKIVGASGDVALNEAAIGETVKYKLTGTLPDNIGEYNTYYVMFTDTLTKGLTYVNGTLKVTVDGEDVTKYFYKSIPAYADDKDTTIKVGMEDLLELTDVTKKNSTDKISITKNTTIVITYDAVVNEFAVINGTGNKNDVKLAYSNDPNQDGTGDNDDDPPPTEPSGEPNPSTPKGETPKKEVFTYVTELKIYKYTTVDGEKTALPGATFRLTGTSVTTDVETGDAFVVNANAATPYYRLDDGTYTTTAPGAEDTADNSDYADVTTRYAKVDASTTSTDSETVNMTGTSDKDGYITFKGLGAGTYTVTEIVTPEGYNTAAPVAVTVTFDEDKKTFTFQGTTEGARLDIENKAGVVLPESGGEGTTMFYVIGGILVLAAVVLLVTRKRMSAEE